MLDIGTDNNERLGKSNGEACILAEREIWTGVREVEENRQIDLRDREFGWRWSSDPYRSGRYWYSEDIRFLVVPSVEKKVLYVFIMQD